MEFGSVVFRLNGDRPTLLFVGVVAVLAMLGAAPSRAQDDSIDYTDFSLTELLQTDVVYGASKFEQTTKDAPSAVTIVGADDIKAFGYRTLAEVLASIRGFYTTYDRNYSYLGARGFGRPGDYNSRVLVLINGIRTNENVYDSAAVEQGFPLDLELIQRIEVVRGPSSSLYGTSAIFAIVNIITKSAHAFDGVQVSGHVGSFGTYGGRFTIARGADEGLDWMVSGSAGRIDGQDHYFAEFDDPETNNGVFEDGDETRWQRLFGKIDRGPLHLEALYGWYDKTNPTAPWETMFNDSGTGTTDNSGHLAIWYDGEIKPGTRLLTRMTYGGYDYEGAWVCDYADEGDPEWRVVNKDNGIGRWLNSEAQLTRQIGDGHMLAIGADYRKNTKQDQAVWDDDPYWSYFDDHRDSDNSAIYALGEWRASRAVRLNVGVRQDHYSTFGSSTNPRLALVTEPRIGSVVKILYGSAFRAPNQYELYYNDGGATTKANPDLNPETIKTVEVVIDQSLGSSAHGSLSAFKYTNNDLIDQVEDPADGLSVYRNNAEVEAVGYELEIQTRTRAQWKSTASYSFVEAKYASGNELLTNSPQHMVKVRLLAPVAAVSATVGLEIRHASRRKTVLGGYTDGSTLANLTVVHAPLSAGYELIAGVYNLLDADDSHPAGLEHVQESIRQDGRNLRLTIVLRP